LITNADQPEKVAGAVAECRRLGISVPPPNINRSQTNFSIEPDNGQAPAIRFGLAAIKNVGSGAVEPIVIERNKGGEFKSVEDFCRRCDLRGVNKRVIESLIKAGALDTLGNRGTLLHNINSILSLAQREQRLRETGQATMFDLWGETTPLPLPSLNLEAADISVEEKLAWERELMGVCLSEQSFSPVASGAGSETTFCGQVDAELAGQSIIVAGRVASVRYLYTKDNRAFVSAVLEDFSGRVEAMVWPKVYDNTRELWQEGSELLIEGKVRLRDDRVQLNCDSVSRYQPEVAESEAVVAPEPVEVPAATAEPVADIALSRGHRLVISVSQTSDEDNDKAGLYQLFEALKGFPGSDEVSLCLSSEGRVVNLKLPHTTGYCPELHQRLVELVGEEGVRVERFDSN